MIKLKQNIDWYRWVRMNLRNPEFASDYAPYIVDELVSVCRTCREMAVGLWAVLDLATLISVEAVERKLQEVIEEVEEDAEG